MAAGSMKAIKGRIKSVESTMQITKAMELVASSKLRKAKENAENAKPFYDILKQAIGDIIVSADSVSSPFLNENKTGCDCYVVIAGDRGLAGGYNNNLFKLVKSKTDMKKDCVIPVGKVATEMYARYNCERLTDDFDTVAVLGVSEAGDLSKLICSLYEKKKFDRVFLVYTRFVSMLSQQAEIQQILPLNKEDFTGSPNKKAVKPLTIYDTSQEDILERVIPQYISGSVFTAIKESFASECAARRTAMNSASKNAEEMIGNLTLHYNRARQSAITQEITEIISGAEAL